MDIPAVSPPDAADEPQVTALLDVLLPLLAVAPEAGRPLIVGIDGPSGSGKSTLARRLAARLAPATEARAGEPGARLHDHGGMGSPESPRIPRESPASGRGAPAIVHLVAMDDLYPGWDGLEAGTEILVRDVLEPLNSGDPASYPRWDWLHHRPSRRRVEVPAARVVIVEGAGSCARRCAPYLASQIWLDAPEPVRFERAMARDGDSYRPHWQRWAAQERAHFCAERTAERADLRLDA